jgi:hypothetical protein
MKMYHEKGMDIRNTNFNIISTTVVITPFAERRAHKPMRRWRKLSPHFSQRNMSTISNEYHGDVTFHRVAEKL